MNIHYRKLTSSIYTIHLPHKMEAKKIQAPSLAGEIFLFAIRKSESINFLCVACLILYQSRHSHQRPQRLNTLDTFHTSQDKGVQSLLKRLERDNYLAKSFIKASFIGWLRHVSIPHWKTTEPLRVNGLGNNRVASKHTLSHEGNNTLLQREAPLNRRTLYRLA